jgi:hypothetical protein
VSGVRVVQLGPGHYRVQVSEGHITTSHKVAVSDQLVDDLGLADVDRKEIVEQAMRFLLEREPVTATRGDFPLDDIAVLYPELKARLRQ